MEKVIEAFRRALDQKSFEREYLHLPVTKPSYEELQEVIGQYILKEKKYPKYVFICNGFYRYLMKQGAIQDFRPAMIIAHPDFPYERILATDTDIRR